MSRVVLTPVAEADLDRAAAMGTNAHRLSLEWSRIEPEPGIFDDDAIDRIGVWDDDGRIVAVGEGLPQVGRLDHGRAEKLQVHKVFWEIFAVDGRVVLRAAAAGVAEEPRDLRFENFARIVV